MGNPNSKQIITHVKTRAKILANKVKAGDFVDNIGILVTACFTDEQIDRLFGEVAITDLQEFFDGCALNFGTCVGEWLSLIVAGEQIPQNLRTFKISDLYDDGVFQFDRTISILREIGWECATPLCTALDQLADTDVTRTILEKLNRYCITDRPVYALAVSASVSRMFRSYGIYYTGWEWSGIAPDMVAIRNQLRALSDAIKQESN